MVELDVNQSLSLAKRLNCQQGYKNVEQRTTENNLELNSLSGKCWSKICLKNLYSLMDVIRYSRHFISCNFPDVSVKYDLRFRWSILDRACFRNAKMDRLQADKAQHQKIQANLKKVWNKLLVILENQIN